MLLKFELSDILLRAEDSVTGVTETGDDIAMVVELFIKSGNENVYVRVILLHFCNTLGSTNYAHELNVLNTVVLKELDCRGSRAAGGKHRVNNDNIALSDIGGIL